MSRLQCTLRLAACKVFFFCDVCFQALVRDTWPVAAVPSAHASSRPQRKPLRLCNLTSHGSCTQGVFASSSSQTEEETKLHESICIKGHAIDGRVCGTTVRLTAAQPELANDGRMVQVGTHEERVCELCEEWEDAAGGVDDGWEDGPGRWWIRGCGFG